MAMVYFLETIVVGLIVFVIGAVVGGVLSFLMLSWFWRVSGQADDVYDSGFEKINRARAAHKGVQNGSEDGKGS